jgi:hypothetical protein
MASGFLGVSLIITSSASAASGDGSSATRFLKSSWNAGSFKHSSKRLPKNLDAIVGSSRRKHKRRAGAL